MINPQNQRTAKIMELLQQTGLFSEDELIWTEDYLSGEEDGAGLPKLQFRDFSAVPGELAMKIREFMRKAPDQMAGRLAELLFAVGHSTCREMVVVAYEYTNQRKEVILPEAEKKAALYAAEIGTSEYMLSSHTFRVLIKLANGDPDIMKKAYAYQKGTDSKGKIILLMAYFQMKYPNVRLVEEGHDGKAGGLLAAAGRLLGRGEKDGGVYREIPKEDMELLKEYGETLAGNIGQLYGGQLSRLEIDEIQNAVYRDDLNERILKMAGKNVSGNRFMLRFLGCTAFINYAQSPLLQNTVRICMAVGTEAMLNYMHNMDLRDDMTKRGGDYDEIFGVAPRKLIAWAAANGESKILKTQFARNREIYLGCMKGGTSTGLTG